MNEHSTESKVVAGLLPTLLALIAAHRPAFGQERVYRRGVALVVGELFVFARHTVTQSLLALGLAEVDGTAFYRLFSRQRFEVEVLWNCLLDETLPHSEPTEPYVTLPRSRDVDHPCYPDPASDPPLTPANFVPPLRGPGTGLRR